MEHILKVAGENYCLHGYFQLAHVANLSVSAATTKGLQEQPARTGCTLHQKLILPRGLTWRSRARCWMAEAGAPGES